MFRSNTMTICCINIFLQALDAVVALHSVTKSSGVQDQFEKGGETRGSDFSGAQTKILILDFHCIFTHFS